MAKIWLVQRDVMNVFSNYNSQACHARIAGANGGWYRMKPGSANGVTNMHTIMAAACANNRKVTAYVDTADKTVWIAYLL